MAQAAAGVTGDGLSPPAMVLQVVILPTECCQAAVDVADGAACLQWDRVLPLLGWGLHRTVALRLIAARYVSQYSPGLLESIVRLLAPLCDLQQLIHFGVQVLQVAGHGTTQGAGPHSKLVSISRIDFYPPVVLPFTTHATPDHIRGWLSVVFTPIR